MVAVGEVFDTFHVEPMTAGKDVDGGEQTYRVQTDRTFRIGNHFWGMEDSFFEVMTIVHTGDTKEDVVQKTEKQFFGFLRPVDRGE